MRNQSFLQVRYFKRRQAIGESGARVNKFENYYTPGFWLDARSNETRDPCLADIVASNIILFGFTLGSGSSGDYGGIATDTLTAIENACRNKQKDTDSELSGGSDGSKSD